METKHTKGPWKYERTATRFRMLDSEGFIVFTINGGAVPVEANARLMAAAPKLLEACKDLLYAFEQPGKMDGWSLTKKNAWNKAGDAVAKAEGR